ncbi:MAG: DNA mismatch repair endonuclease MutL [bacterium]|nr:DNA mismatch repair endonuclease MutL [bacterium]
MSIDRISLLPEVVRNQIAAGEVIERPASVVKELVENALDAGATRIQVDLEEGGVKLVRITDDGCGMSRADLALAFEPHATSKLRSPEDLEHIASLGFRGEALASMGSIARCSIFSRPADEELGARIENVGGRISEVREAGGAAGTIVEVRDLFFNTPARRKFLKRTSTELGRCLDVAQRAALAHRGVGFVVTHDGKRAYDVEPEMDLLDRIRRTFGAELADALVPVSAEAGTTRLFGYVAPPRFSRRDTSRQMWFLNGRSLRDKVLSRILREGYHGFLEDFRQPVVFLTLSLDPGVVDVNVHPAKSEVRFREQRRLFGFLVNALREAVSKTDMSTPGDSMIASMRRRTGEDERQPALPVSGPAHRPDPGVITPAPRPEPFVVREVEGRPFSTATVAPGSAQTPAQRPVQTPAQTPVQTREDWKARDDLRGPFLQVARTYIVRALPDGFEIVDQHALHERLTYELMRRDVRENAVEIQSQLVPELVECSRADVELLSGHLDGLRRIGLDLAVFGETTIAVQGLPVRLHHPDAEGVVRDLIEILGRTGKAPEAEDVIEEVLHSAACRSSIMAGDELTEDDIRSLLSRAGELESDQTCPHARPTRVRFDLADLEKAFHRR